MPKVKQRFHVRETLAVYWAATRGYRVSIFVQAVVVLAATTLQYIITPWMVSRGIGQMPAFLAQTGNSFEATFGGLVFWYLLAQFGTWLLWRLLGWSVVTVQPKIMCDLENLCFAHLNKMSYQFFADTFGGGLVAKTGRFIGSFVTLYDTIIFNVLTLILRLVMSIGVIAFFAPTAAGAMAGLAVVYIAVVVIMFRWKAPLSKAKATAQSELTARRADCIANIATIKYFAREPQEIRDFSRVVEGFRKITYRSWGMDEIVMSVQAFLLLAGESMIFIIALHLMASRQIDFGQFVLIQAYIWGVFGSLWNVGNIVRNVERSMSDAVEMTEILLVKPGVADVVGAKKVSIDRGLVELKDLSFSYNEDKKQQAVFEKLNLRIEPGEKIGLVGPSGGGKTTVTKLLLRLMDVGGGQILLDGHDVARMRQADVRGAISYVPQEPLLFHRTLRENIAYGRPGATMAMIREVAARAHAAEFIDNLPQGYETMVGERGIKLSGGQRQRVAIARAMLKDAPILVLDEATSALDSESERLIQDALLKLMEGRTAIVVAHRLSTIQRMDRIVVLADGGVAECGSHAELLARGGIYARLWARQSGGFIDEDKV